MKESGPFSMPGGGSEMKVSTPNPPANKFAEPGGATALPTGRGPDVMPREFTGQPGPGEK